MPRQGSRRREGFDIMRYAEDNLTIFMAGGGESGFDSRFARNYPAPVGGRSREIDVQVRRSGFPAYGRVRERRERHSCVRTNKLKLVPHSAFRNRDSYPPIKEGTAVALDVALQCGSGFRTARARFLHWFRRLHLG